MQTTSAKWMSFAKERQKALDDQIKQDVKVGRVKRESTLNSP